MTDLKEKVDLTKLQAEIKNEKTAENLVKETKINPIPVIVTPTPTSSDEPRVKRAYKKRVVVTSNLTADNVSPATVKAMLRMPFSTAKHLTGFNGFVIPEPLEKDMVDMCMQIFKDFGIAELNRWLNLGMFSFMYFGMFALPMREFLIQRAEQIEANEKKDVKNKDKKDDK